MTRSVLMTGATGFLGSALLRRLVENGDSVTVLVRPSSDTWRIADVLPRVSVVVLDGGNMPPIKDAGYVLHVATAYGRQGTDVEESNVHFPMRLLDFAISGGTRAFITTGTFITRGNPAPIGLRSYADSKLRFREQARERANGRLPLVELELEHVYGPRDNPEKFIPSLLRALLAGERRFALTPGGQRRDFVFVDDVVDAYMMVLDAFEAIPSKTFTSFSVGRGESVPLRQAVELAKALCGADTTLGFGDLPYQADEIMDSRADTTAMRALGWRPRVSLREGMELVVADAKTRAPLGLGR